MVLVISMDIYDMGSSSMNTGSQVTEALMCPSTNTCVSVMRVAL